ncbi:MAG TPA: hypothetical protein VK842_08520 [bacterium]|jgi:hypothetical protein|nr:hypothetical protein [bacterium]
MNPKHPQPPESRPAEPSPQRADPIPFGSREDQVERRHPGAQTEPPIEERRKNDDVGGED